MEHLRVEEEVSTRGKVYALRVLISIPTLLVIRVVVYSVVAFAPGEPLWNMGGRSDIPFEIWENICLHIGPDQTVYVRYFKWLVAYMHSDWGYSFGSRNSASTLISLCISTTLCVIGLAYVIAVLIAIPLCVLTAVCHNTRFDNIFSGVRFVGFSRPTFFSGVLLIILFRVKICWLPMVYTQQVSTPFEWIKQTIIPITVLALLQTATLNRYI